MLGLSNFGYYFMMPVCGHENYLGDWTDIVLEWILHLYGGGRSGTLTNRLRNSVVIGTVRQKSRDYIVDQHRNCVGNSLS